MPPHGPLSGLLARATTAADPAAREAAFDELLRLLMIYIRAAMGHRLRDHRESIDVCQSIAKSFVGDFEEGRIAFDSEAAVAAYLKKTVRSKLADLARHDNAHKRAAHHSPIDSHGPATQNPGPRSLIIEVEDKARALGQLTDEERTLIDLRQRGIDWETIAQQLGKDPATLRQQFSRAQRRIAEGAG
jgi:DNA-directed RNA polymerase specialized sigma24 family protein